MIFVIPLVVEGVAAERDIADGKVEKTVRQLGLLKSLHRNAGILVQLLGDAAREGVQLHAIQTAVLHGLWHQAKEVANAAGGLQDVARVEAHVLHRLIDGLNDSGGRVMGVEGGGFGSLVFLGGQKHFQLGEFLRPLLVVLVKGLRQAAPAHIPGQDFLFLRGGQPSFGFDLL